MNDFSSIGASYSKNFVICIVTKKGGQTNGKQTARWRRTGAKAR